jgi:hypothetical protein
MARAPAKKKAAAKPVRSRQPRKQLQEITPDGREERDPTEDFVNSLYEMGDGAYGFPVTALKRAIVEVAHKDKGIIREETRAGLWLDHTIVRVRPAFPGAICDVPLIRLVAGKPEMREDMVKVGTGLHRTANLAYRGQFFPWAINITGRVNAATLSEEALISLILWAGLEKGIGDWRNEKNGLMGAFHPCDEAEARVWERFRSGDGPIPMPDNYRIAA